MNQKRITLAIDARPLSRGSGGIQRYLKRIIPHLIASGEFDIILYSDGLIEGVPDDILSKIKVRQTLRGKLAAVSWYWMAPIWIRLDRADSYWSPRHHLPFFTPKSTATIVTIHDFVWKKVPQTMPRIQWLTERLLMPTAIRSTNKIICISQTTQSQLEEYFPGAEKKSKVILHGEETSSHITGPSNTSKSVDSYFLTVGTLEPRKNYESLIRAFDMYCSEGGTVDLIIVGKNGWNYQSIYDEKNKSNFSSRIKILNSVNDEELITLYQGAQGFISISIDEGYGLPPQEAMAFGLPILLSTIDVYRELYPSADLWVNNHDINEISHAISQLNKLPKKNTYTPNGRLWSDCAKQHIKYIKA
ncbi:glycosyltransferase family 4 protein [Arenicella xantha]|uniref:Glycosyltransferase involved in cell wall biosynthesis n=1 Tax=Arenicella xantha TaxID=644221 RepID=A0A395JPJ5_9GAMM|nr:glycosyltransferase family 1 protein [Arenicella xantha]RBP51494.1 glycosyltransferase involved in cell wall biosynthesis [Arenicella xantha]